MSILGASPRLTYSYPRIRYGSAGLVLSWADPALGTPRSVSDGKRATNLVADGQAEYLYGYLEAGLALDLWFTSDLHPAVRVFAEQWAIPGSQFEFWLDQYTASVWAFAGALTDQNGLAWTLNGGGSAAYVAGGHTLALDLAVGQYLSVARAQSSAVPRTGYDDPIVATGGVVCLDFAPYFAGNDGAQHFLVDTTGATNRLKIVKETTNKLAFTIVDNAAGVKTVEGTVTWTAGQRVQVVARWDNAGVLELWYAVAGGTFVALTDAAGAGTGILASLGTNLFLSAQNDGTALARCTWYAVSISTRAWSLPSVATVRLLADHLPCERNYFAYAELMGTQWAPTRTMSGRPIYRWSVLLRNGQA